MGDLPRRKVGAANVTNLALTDEVVQRSQGFLNWSIRVGSMDVVQVYVVGLQPAQALLRAVHYPASRRSYVVWQIAHRESHLGRYDDVVAPAGDRLADVSFRNSRGIDIGRVYVVDAQVHRSSGDRYRVRFVNMVAEHGPEGVCA